VAGTAVTTVNSDTVRRAWAERTGEFSPRYYAYRGPDESSEQVCEALADAVGRDATVLELGCSSGRHLAHLREQGFTDLHGVEINETALEVMAEAFPELAAEGTFYTDPIEEFLPATPPGRFDAVFSVQALQHVPPADWSPADLVSATGEALVVVENEGDSDLSSGGDVNFVDDDVPLFYRDWGDVFTDAGATQTASVNLDPKTLRVFRT
jgi:SAM-dependent methyltransferase